MYIYRPEQGAFQQFAGLEYIRFTPGKPFGFVKYTTDSVAAAALGVLNGSMVAGVKLKIQIAEPPSNPDANKRQRM